MSRRRLSRRRKIPLASRPATSSRRLPGVIDLGSSGLRTMTLLWQTPLQTYGKRFESVESYSGVESKRAEAHGR